MDQDDHHHDHEHGRDHPVEPVRQDHAGKSLSEALRLSFHILTALMILFVLVFLGTGFKTIKSSEVGIKTIFGKIVGIAEPGLAYNWPFPVGEIIVVNTGQQELKINDFWLHETPEEVWRPLESRSTLSEGIRPGYDGVALTGDRGLLHMQLTCSYSVRDPVSFKMNVSDPVGTLRMVANEAVVREAGQRTADGLKASQAGEFAVGVRATAQKKLDALTSGITLEQVSLTRSTWPIKALPEFNEASNARSQAQSARNTAMGKANSILNDAAGPNYGMLVGDFLGQGPSDPNKPYDLIGQYEQSREAKDKAKAAALLEQIETTLASNEVTGQASAIINEAQAYKTAIKQRVEGRTIPFTDLLPQFRAAPQFLMERLWADTKDAILGSPTNELFYVDVSQGDKTVLKVNPDPAVRKRITETILKNKSEKDKEKKPSGQPGG